MKPAHSCICRDLPGGFSVVSMPWLHEDQGWQFDYSSIGRRWGVAGHSGNVGACTCSVSAVSNITLLKNISWLECCPLHSMTCSFGTHTVLGLLRWWQDDIQMRLGVYNTFCFCLQYYWIMLACASVFVDAIKMHVGRWNMQSGRMEAQVYQAWATGLTKALMSSWVTRSVFLDTLSWMWRCCTLRFAQAHAHTYALACVCHPCMYL